MQIIQASLAQARQISNVLSTCFLVDFNETLKSLRSDPRRDIKDFYVSLEEKEITGCLCINQLETFIRGYKLKFGGIGGVAVPPEFRRKGIAEELVVFALNLMYQQKYPISILYPFQHKFYKKFGWELTGQILKYDIAPSNIVQNENRLNVRRWTKKDKEKIKNIFLEYSKKGNCSVFRNNKFWDEKIFPKWKEVMVYEDKSISGYLVYEFYKDNNYTNLFVKEFICLETNAYSGLLAFLASLGEQINKIEYLTPVDEPVFMNLRNPVAANYDRLFFEYKSLASLGSGFMLRIVNLKEALSYVNHSRDDDFELTFRIEDKIIEENNNPIVLSCKKGKLAISEDQIQGPVIACDINTFSVLYSGLLTATKLRQFGKILCDEASAQICDKLFKAPAPFIQQADIF
jgi:predicted acetyltransferase